MCPRSFELWSGPTLITIILYSAPVLAQNGNSTGFQGDDFSNNLLSDLAPLIALFGEQVAKQYLSQSMHWLEHIIFACAPLGMITAITCAIRVAGNKTLRAVIGRAREPGAQAEIEVMSSTSPDVCELWNGVGIVRVAGSPDIIEVIYDRAEAGVEKACQDDERHLGVYKREHVFVSPDSNHNPRNQGASNSGTRGVRLETFRNRPSLGDFDQESNPLLGDSGDADAPNISINTTNPGVRKWELWVTAAIGVALQVGVLVFDWVALNYSQLPWRKGGSKVSEYAFPLTLVGTLAVVGGMFICAYVIELSTMERVWMKEPTDKRDLQILWLQRGQTVNDQKFKSYAIYAARNQKTITTSRPVEFKEKRYHLLTTAGTVVSVIGFILQFVGLRAMHYSATLAQLLAMAIMTILRVLLRRNLTAKPKSFKVNETPPSDQKSHYVKELPENHELDSVAKQMTNCSSWNVVVTRDPSVHPDELATAEISRVLNARIRLGQIAGLAWEGKLHDTVLSLTQAMEALMNHFWSPSGGGIFPTDEMKLKTNFDWSLSATITTNPPAELRATITSNSPARLRNGSVELQMTRTPSGDTLGPWKANRKDIEAIFSLWMSHLSQLRNIGDEGENLWIIGATGDGGHDVGRVLCDWWISREIDYIELGKIDETREERKIHKSRILYCMKATPTAETLQGIVNTTSLTQMCAQLILSNFMSAAARAINPIESETTFEPITGKRLLKALNKDVQGLVDIFERSGLATVDDAYRIVVPALFEAGTLPSLLDRVPEVLRIVKQFEDAGRANAVCGRIRSICIYKANSLINYGNYGEARAVCMRLVKAFVQELGRKHPETLEMRRSLRKFGQSLAKDLAVPLRDEQEPPVDPVDAQTIRFPLHHAIITGWPVKLYNNLSEDENWSIEEWSNERKTPLALAVEKGDGNFVTVLLSFGVDATTYGIEEQTALHIATNLPEGAPPGSAEFIIKLLLDNGADINDQQNPQSQTPLQSAAALGKESIVKHLVERGAILDLKDKMGRTAVYWAAESGSQEVVQLLIGKGADPDIKDGSGRTAMHRAAEMGRNDVVRYLAQKGSHPVTKDNNGETPLHTAASNGHDESVKSLLKFGADPDAKNKLGTTPMHKAAQMGQEGLVKLFLETGSDPDIKDHEGKTAVHKAAGKGHEGILKLLVEKGSDLDAKDKLGRTAVHCAAEMGHLSVLQLLIDMGYDPDLKDKTGGTSMQTAASNGHKTAVEFLVQNGADPDAKDKFGKTAMHKAAEMGKLAVVQLFLEKGSDPSVKDGEGRTAMHTAAEKGHRSIVELLIEKGATLDAKANSGETPLHRATEMGHHSVVQLFLDRGSDPNAKDSEGRTALHMAASNRYKAAMNFLIQQGADCDFKDLLGRNAMHRAAEAGDRECVELLIGYGAGMSARNTHGDTAMHMAAGKGHEAVVQLLVESGADPDAKNKLGRTPLHQAAEGGYGAVIKLLLGSGADLGARDNSGMTAVMIAEGNGNEHLRKLLLGTGRR